MSGYPFGGTYRRCPACESPMVVPFPPDWHLDLIKDGPELGPVDILITPHVPGCQQPMDEPDPGFSIRVTGRDVSHLGVSLP